MRITCEPRTNLIIGSGSIAAFVLISLLAPISVIRESLWIDELHTGWSVFGSWSMVSERSALGNQSPLYFWIVKAIVSAVGIYEWSLRILSVTAWSGMIFCLFRMFLVGRALPAGGSKADRADEWKSNDVGCKKEDPGCERDEIRVGFEGSALRAEPALRNCVLLWALIWLGLESIGIFYATEARPYACVAACGLGLIVAAQRRRGSFFGLNAIWILVAWIAFYLHYSAGMVIAASWLGRLIVFFFNRNEDWRTGLRSLVAEGVIFVLGVIPALWHLTELLHKSQQWSGFASDTSWSATAAMFPFGPWILVPFLGVVFERVILGRQKQVSNPGLQSNGILESGSQSNQLRDNRIEGGWKEDFGLKILPQDPSPPTPLPGYGARGVTTPKGAPRKWIASRCKWIISRCGAINSQSDGSMECNPASRLALLIQCTMVAILPTIVAWILTYFEIAPLMHRRYLIGSYSAVLLVGLLLLNQLRCPVRIVAIGLLATLCLIYQQETWHVWQSGQIIGWQRGENWSGAVGWLNKNVPADTEIWMAPNLIETSGDHIDESLPRDYLLFPLNNLYLLKNTDRVRHLPNNAEGWAKQIIFPARGESKRFCIITRQSIATAEKQFVQFLNECKERGLLTTRDRVESFGGVQIMVLNVKRPN